MSNVFVCVCVCVLWFPILSVCVLSARQRGGFRQRNGERIRGEDKKNQGLVWDCSSSFSLIDGVGGEGKEAFLCLFSFLSVAAIVTILVVVVVVVFVVVFVVMVIIINTVVEIVVES